MEMLRFFREAVILLCVFVVAGCVDGPRNLAGSPMQLSDYREVKAEELYFKLDGITPGRITKIEKRTRDNAIEQYRITLDNGSGVIWHERLLCGLSC